KLFPITRTFKILGFIYISITEKRAYNMLYAVIFLTIGLYALISALRLRKAVKRV
ncbi:MAG TPA: hypothetical protein GX001_00755, partial [Acholeplasmataceae bacterium]|nr:hypothetical protein [Acholeplasmataceae bacterium]